MSTTARLINRGIPKGTLLANTYLVEKPLGCGGMAEVYLARHKTQHTLHAVKVIHASMEGNTMATDLFNREARILQEVNHDAVVRYQGSPLDAEGHVFLITQGSRSPPPLQLALVAPGEMGVSQVQSILCRRDHPIRPGRFR